MFLNEGLEVINVNCFCCSGLENIIIPRSVKLIGDNAFEYCESLKYVCFLGSALETIGECAFSHSALESFVAPSSLLEIKESAFFGCKALKHVDLSACL